MSDQTLDAPAALQPMTVEKALAGTFDKAMAMDSGSLETPTPESSSAPEFSAPSLEAPAATLSPADAKVLELPDDGVVRVKVDGKEQLLPVQEFKSGISREAHYTQRMQQLAEQKREAEAALAGQYAQLQQEAQAILLAQQQLAAYAQQAQQPQAYAPQGQMAPAPQDPGDLATVGDVQASLQQAMTQLVQQQQYREQQMLAAIGQASQQVQEQAALQRDTLTYTKGLQSVLAKPDYEVLTKVLPYAEESIRYQVAAMDPPTIEDAVAYTEQVAKEWVTKLRGEVLDSQKRQQVAQARAKLEPPAGSPPSPNAGVRQQFFRKDGKLDWDALHARASALMG